MIPVSAVIAALTSFLPVRAGTAVLARNGRPAATLVLQADAPDRLTQRRAQR